MIEIDGELMMLSREDNWQNCYRRWTPVPREQEVWNAITPLGSNITNITSLPESRRLGCSSLILYFEHIFIPSICK